MVQGACEASGRSCGDGQSKSKHRETLPPQQASRSHCSHRLQPVLTCVPCQLVLTPAAALFYQKDSRLPQLARHLVHTLSHIPFLYLHRLVHAFRQEHISLFVVITNNYLTLSDHLTNTRTGLWQSRHNWQRPWDRHYPGPGHNIRRFLTNTQPESSATDHPRPQCL